MDTIVAWRFASDLASVGVRRNGWVMLSSGSERGRNAVCPEGNLLPPLTVRLFRGMSSEIARDVATSFASFAGSPETQCAIRNEIDDHDDAESQGALLSCWNH